MKSRDKGKLTTRRKFLQESSSAAAGLLLPVGRGIDRADVGSAALEAWGLVDVTSAPFYADASGKSDSTQCLQMAIDYASSHRMAVFFPCGTYRVSGTLHCAQHCDIDPCRQYDVRDWPIVLVGSRGGKGKPRILLAPRSRGFEDSSKPRYLIYYRYDADRPGGPDRTSSTYNDMFIGIDIEIGEGNFGAIAIRMQAAQGSAIQDSVITMGDGLVGIEGGTGSGGGHVRVTIVGGKIGLDLRKTQPGTTITAVTLIDQTETPIIYSGEQTLTAVGLQIVSNGSGPLIVADDPLSACRVIADRSIDEWLGPITIVDSQLVFKSKPGIAIESTSAVYLNNVYVRNASVIVKCSSGKALTGEPSRWMLVREYAQQVQLNPYLGMQYSCPIYVNGSRVGNIADTAVDLEAPADLQSKHTWNDSFPAWEDPRAINVREDPYRAVGDGKADDTAAIQRAIDEHEIIFLPKGIYRITKTIELRPKSKLLGVGGRFSVLKADEVAFADGSHPKPILRSANDADADTVIAFVGTCPTAPGAFNLHWRSGRNSLVRNWVIVYNSIRESYAHRHPSTLVTENGGGRWYNWFEETWYPELVPSYRHLLVQGTSEPLHVYVFNPEHACCDALTEFRNSRNINIYGAKGEGNCPVILGNESDHIRIFGYSGNASPWPGESVFVFTNASDVLVANAFDRVRQPNAESRSAYVGPNAATDPRQWHMVEEHLGKEVVATLPLERPVLYRRLLSR